MASLWHTLAGWVSYLLAHPEEVTTAIALLLAVVSQGKILAQRLGLTRAAAALGQAQAEIESHREAAVQAVATTAAVVQGVQRARTQGHLDASTFALLTGTIQQTALAADVEQHLAPIVGAIKADLPPAEVVRAATARLTARLDPEAPTPRAGTPAQPS